jgi:hypothetical protein
MRCKRLQEEITQTFDSCIGCTYHYYDDVCTIYCSCKDYNMQFECNSSELHSCTQRAIDKYGSDASDDRSFIVWNVLGAMLLLVLVSLACWRVTRRFVVCSIEERYQ